MLHIMNMVAWLRECFARTNDNDGTAALQVGRRDRS